MMLVAADLRVALVTIHAPLSAVPGLLTIEGVVNTGLVTARALKRDFGIDRAAAGAVPASTRTPANPEPSAARRSMFLNRLSGPSPTWASPSGAPCPPTACSTPTPARPMTPSSACTTTRP
jgi:hypothetical protein